MNQHGLCDAAKKTGTQDHQVELEVVSNRWQNGRKEQRGLMCGVCQRRGVGEEVHQVAIMLKWTALGCPKLFHLNGGIRVLHGIKRFS